MVADREADAVLDFARKTNEQVRQRVIDTGVARDMAYRNIASDWLFDNYAALRRRELKAVLIACWWLTQLIDNNIGLPSALRRGVSKEDVEELVRFLREQTRRARDVKAGKDSGHDKGGGATP